MTAMEMTTNDVLRQAY